MTTNLQNEAQEEDPAVDEDMLFSAANNINTCIRQIVESLGFNDIWEDEHPRFTRSTWQFVVHDGDTLSGYWPWVAKQLQEESDAKSSDS
jgi:hypothetical protein